MARSFYVTTPIYYVNDVPHLGTAYTTIVADALRRYHLLRGEDVFMLTGTDEHGLKLEREAKDRGQTPKQFVDEMSQRFRDAWPKLNIEPDDFIRTTEPRHTRIVQDIWRKVEEKGDLYLAEYEDWYCVGCESFKTEKELEPGNVCPLHKRPVEKVKEETYFFRLSKYEKPLLDLYERRPELIEPTSRRNEVVSFVQGGLKDLSVSRTSFTWGIPVPGNPRHVMYVWFDALANYWSAVHDDPARARYWPPAGKVVHLVGKDILRFHTVYWPAFLLSAFGEEALPSTVFAHGFLTVDGQKMSKTLRNAVDPVRLAQELGADVLRYQLLRAVAFGQDGDFDHAAMIERYNADLGKNLGNLLSRTLGLCAKYTGGKRPPRASSGLARGDEFRAAVEPLLAKAAEEWEGLAPHRALEITWAIASLANQFVDRAAPWSAAKANDWDSVHDTLETLLDCLEALSVLAWPALPTKANELRGQLGLGPVEPRIGSDLFPKDLRRGALRTEALAENPPALFPVIDKDREKELLARLVPAAEQPVVVEKPDPGPLSKAPTMPPPSAPETPILLSYNQFAAIDLRVGVVREAEKVPKKDKLLKLLVDLGEGAPRQIVAGLAQTFAPADLVGKRVIVVANLAPREFGKGLVSHGMLLATGPSEALRLATVEGDVAPGARLK